LSWRQDIKVFCFFPSEKKALPYSLTSNARQTAGTSGTSPPIQ
jgi:hypothetical protein